MPAADAQVYTYEEARALDGIRTYRAKRDHFSDLLGRAVVGARDLGLPLTVIAAAAGLSTDAEGSRFAQVSAADGARVWAVDVDETGAAVAEIEAGDEQG